MLTPYSSTTPPTPARVNARIHAALHALRAGQGIVLLDDDDRENEADLIYAADTMDEAAMAFMIRYCSGIVCLCLEPTRVEQLALPPMVSDNQSRFGTAFTVSIEARHGVTTGVSAADRLTTIRAATHPQARADDLARPGHVFPLRAHPDGVLGRNGHTEGSVDLARLAGLQPAAVLCELMDDQGRMLRGAAVEAFAQLHQLPLLSIAELVHYRRTLAS